MEKTEGKSTSGNYFRFNLGGLILLLVCVISATALVSSKVFDARPKTYSFADGDIPDPDVQDKTTFVRKGPWGELLMQNIQLELPIEYISQEVKNPEPETWKFSNTSLNELKAFLVAHGLTERQVESQLTPNRISAQGTNTLFTPDEDFLLSLNSKTRAQLYSGFFGKGIGLYFDSPFIFSGQTLERIYIDPRLNPEDVSLLKQLVYFDGTSWRLSDYNLLLRRIPSVERRTMMAKVISMEPAVLARLCVRPDSDIDKIAAYWGHMDNVRFTDLRPMLEALKGLPRGGTVSLMYFLPPFARARLYTYPLPSRPGDPRMDCHWSTFNFPNIEINNEINNPQYLMEYIRTNFYKIDAPSQYGDIVVFLNDHNIIKHSAVFLADDLAFTKYGSGYRQPWMTARISDMQTMYPGLRLVFFRRKTE